MKQGSVNYFYALIPFIFGILLCMYKIVHAFANIETESGTDKASVLAEVISNSLWFPVGGFILTAIWIATLIYQVVKTKTEAVK